MKNKLSADAIRGLILLPKYASRLLKIKDSPEVNLLRRLKSLELYGDPSPDITEQANTIMDDMDMEELQYACVGGVLSMIRAIWNAKKFCKEWELRKSEIKMEKFMEARRANDKNRAARSALANFELVDLEKIKSFL